MEKAKEKIVSNVQKETTIKMKDTKTDTDSKSTGPYENDGKHDCTT